MKIRTGVSATLVALLVAALSGCAAPVRAADLVGTYADDNGLRPLVLRAGGDCSAHLLLTGSGTVTGDCRWRLRQHGGTQVRLDFHRDPDAGVYFVDLRVDGSGTGATLYEITDPDLQQRYVLRR